MRGAWLLVPLLSLSLAAREGSELAEDLDGGWRHSHAEKHRDVSGALGPWAGHRSSLAERRQRARRSRHARHRRSRQRPARSMSRRQSEPPETETSGAEPASGGGEDASREEKLQIETAARKEPDDCGPLMGDEPAEVQAQVRRCLKQRKRQVLEVQEKLQQRAKQERLLADESDKVRKLQKEIGDMDATTAAFVNDEQVVKAALEQDKQRVQLRINKLDADGEDAD
ncbi:unnamed protein product [Effrenium voratum]|uniref:Uncharacterized protein n=1 Tax=Effrenium voratum TaxID=2562239 RepID=A0AA36J7P9_9DINO|nr:unnamed protein product [Effrenium voratum]CAJ1417454.1 unnamed protein product [Effrenium voratum]|mmetsp:Transcript_119751/g.284511  ORF Transcript_119751/g.284511 Transcript_119751/m.284511 type:complete len:227 (-) Transcript_119751:100-780(-)